MDTPLKRSRIIPSALVILGGSLIALLVIKFPVELVALLLGCILLLVCIKFPRWLIYTLAVFIPLQDEISFEQLSGARISAQTLGAMLLIVLIALWYLQGRHNTRKIVHIQYLNIIFFYLIMSSVAIAIGPTITGPTQGIWAIYRTVWVAPIIYLGIWIFIRDTKTIHKALAWLSISASFGAFIAVIQTITSGRFLTGIGGNFRYLGFLNPLPPEVITSYSGKAIANLYLGNTKIFRGLGSFFTSNGLGVLLCVSIFITWGLSASSTGKKRWVWLGMFFVQILGLLATFSRSAWAAAIAGGVIILWPIIRKMVKHSKWVPKSLIATLVLALLFVSIIFTNSNIQKRLLTTFTPTQVNEFTWRVAIWDYAGKQILRYPLLGVGTSIIDNTVVQIHDPNTISEFSTHNLFFDIAYQRGLISLVLYIIFWIYYFKSSRQVYLEVKKQNLPDQKLIIGLIAGGVAYIISGVGIAANMVENLATLFWFLFGIITLWKYLTAGYQVPRFEK